MYQRRMVTSALPPAVTPRRCGLSEGVLGQERCREEGGHWRHLGALTTQSTAAPSCQSSPETVDSPSLVLPAPGPSALPPGQLTTDTSEH